MLLKSNTSYHGLLENLESKWRAINLPRSERQSSNDLTKFGKRVTRSSCSRILLSYCLQTSCNPYQAPAGDGSISLKLQSFIAFIRGIVSFVIVKAYSRAVSLLHDISHLPDTCWLEAVRAAIEW